MLIGRKESNQIKQNDSCENLDNFSDINFGIHVFKKLSFQPAMSRVNQRVGRQGLKDVMNVRVDGERQMMKDVLVSGNHIGELT